jgi:hypothetical protein
LLDHQDPREPPVILVLLDHQVLWVKQARRDLLVRLDLMELRAT